MSASPDIDALVDWQARHGAIFAQFRAAHRQVLHAVSLAGQEARLATVHKFLAATAELGRVAAAGRQLPPTGVPDVDIPLAESWSEYLLLAEEVAELSGDEVSPAAIARADAHRVRATKLVEAAAQAVARITAARTPPSHAAARLPSRDR